MPDLHVPIEPLLIPRPPVPQEPERLFLLVCSNGPNEPATTWRRATADDLLAFGFGAIRSAPDLEPEQIMAEFITKLPGRTQVTLLRLLQERYGDGT